MWIWAFIGWAAAADPTYILVDRSTWLYSHPNAEARRFRVAELGGAPPYADAPVIVLEKLGEASGFVRARTVPMPRPTDVYARLGDYTYVPEGWNHCYAEPATIASWSAEVWLRPDDLLPVLTRAVSFDLADGSHLKLAPGLAVVGAGDRWRVSSEHLTLTVTLDPADVGRSYRDADLQAQPARAYTATGDAGRYTIDPMWRARFAVQGSGTTLLGARLDPIAEPAAAQIEDRCVSLTLAAPIDGVPDRPPVDNRLRMPTVVPHDTLLSWSGDDNLARVVGGWVIWSRQTCALRGELTCCDPFEGLDVESPPGESSEVCIHVDLPHMTVQRSLQDVYDEMRDTLAARVGTEWDLANHTNNITWLSPTVSGDLKPDTLNEALTHALPNLKACYYAAILHDATTGGRMLVRFGLQSDGSIRGARAVVNDTNDRDLAECITNRLDSLRVLDQIGEDPATVNLDMMFQPPRQRSAIDPNAPSPEPVAPQ